MASKRLAELAAKLYEYMEVHSLNGTFTGSITTAYDDCGISRAHYRRLWALLIDSSCITVETSKFKKTVVHLHRPPEVEAMIDQPLTVRPKSDRTLLESRVTALEERIGEVNITVALNELTNKVKELEALIAP